MITGLRAALISDGLEQRPDGKMSYLGVYSYGLRTDSRPGLLKFWLTLIVELDEQATSGQVEIRSADYQLKVPFQSPAGLNETAVCLEVVLPVLQPSPLTVTVSDDNVHGRTVSTSWALDIAPDAKVLNERAGSDVLGAAKKYKERLLTSIRAHQHQAA